MFIHLPVVFLFVLGFYLKKSGVVVDPLTQAQLQKNPTQLPGNELGSASTVNVSKVQEEILYYKFMSNVLYPCRFTRSP